MVPGARGAETITCHRGVSALAGQWHPPTVLSRGELADWFPRAHMPTYTVFLPN